MSATHTETKVDPIPLIHVSTTTFNWKDRLRALFGFTLHIRSRIEVHPGESAHPTTVQAEWWAPPRWWPRRRRLNDLCTASRQ